MRDEFDEPRFFFPFRRSNVEPRPRKPESALAQIVFFSTFAGKLKIKVRQRARANRKVYTRKAASDGAELRKIRIENAESPRNAQTVSGKTVSQRAFFLRSAPNERRPTAKIRARNKKASTKNGGKIVRPRNPSKRKRKARRVPDQAQNEVVKTIN
jgi:hypothetical protein